MQINFSKYCNVQQRYMRSAFRPHLCQTKPTTAPQPQRLSILAPTRWQYVNQQLINRQENVWFRAYFGGPREYANEPHYQTKSTNICLKNNLKKTYMWVLIYKYIFWYYIYEVKHSIYQNNHNQSHLTNKVAAQTLSTVKFC